MSTPRTVRLLLLDADAVVQRMPAGWLESVLAHIAGGWGHAPDALAHDTALWGRSRAVLDEVFAAEIGLLSGAEGDPTFPQVIAEVLAAHDNAADPDTLAEFWYQTEPLVEQRALVVRARRAGLRVVMATNQQPSRAAWLAESDAFADIADAVHTSSALGEAKPDAAFFVALLAAEAAAGHPVDPAEAVFIDDREENVAGARQAGLVAHRYHFGEGPEAFAALLHETGVLPGA